MADYAQAYDDFSGFEIDTIEESDTGTAPSSISFEYTNPSITIDSGAEFVVHNIVGGAQVRQRIGDNPLEISIDGVCKESTAADLDQLRNAKFGTIYSSRFPDGAVVVHFVSVGTDPLEDGGAVKQDGEEFLYTYNMQCVEIRDSA